MLQQGERRGIFDASQRLRQVAAHPMGVRDDRGNVGLSAILWKKISLTYRQALIYYFG